MLVFLVTFRRSENWMGFIFGGQMPHKLIEWKLNKFGVRLEINSKSSEFNVKMDWMTCSLTKHSNWFKCFCFRAHKIRIWEQLHFYSIKSLFELNGMVFAFIFALCFSLYQAVFCCINFTGPHFIDRNYT